MRTIDLIMRGIYLPLENLDFKKDPNFLLQEIEAEWENRYKENFLNPFIYIQSLPSELQKKARPLLSMVFGSCPGCIPYEDLDLTNMKKELKRYERLNITWDEFLTRIEKMARKFFDVLPLRNIPEAALHDMPYSAFALLSQVDDKVPDNKTAVWPMELWLEELPENLEPRFEKFLNRLENKEELKNILKEELSEDKASFLEARF